MKDVGIPKKDASTDSIPENHLKQSPERFPVENLQNSGRKPKKFY